MQSDLTYLTYLTDLVYLSDRHARGARPPAPSQATGGKHAG